MTPEERKDAVEHLNMLGEALSTMKHVQAFALSCLVIERDQPYHEMMARLRALWNATDHIVNEHLKAK